MKSIVPKEDTNKCICVNLKIYKLLKKIDPFIIPLSQSLELKLQSVQAKKNNLNQSYLQ